MSNHCSTEEEERLALRVIREQIDDNAERKPQVGKGEPGENKGENVVLQARVLVNTISTADLLSPSGTKEYAPTPGCGKRTSG